MSFDDFFDPEPLDAELAPYVNLGRSGMTVLQHPLVYSVPYIEPMNKQLNAQLRYKKEEIEKALGSCRWNRYVFLHERPYRLNALRKVFYSIPDDRLAWRLVGDVWVDSENIHQNESEWRTILQAPRPDHRYMMGFEDRVSFDQMLHGPVLRLYRGYQYSTRRRGLSWTLDRERAEFFARRLLPLGMKPKLATAQARPTDIIAYFTGRGESEVVVFPEVLHNISSQSCPERSQS